MLRRSFPSIDFIPVLRLRSAFRDHYTDGNLRQRDQVYARHVAHCLTNEILSVARDRDLVCWALDCLCEVRPDLRSFPVHNGYLAAEHDRIGRHRACVEQKARGRLAVGLAWSSLLLSASRRPFFSDLTDWAPLFESDNIAVFSLQPNVNAAEKSYLERRGWELIVLEDIDLKDDFEETGALMCALDHVVSPPTTMVEFAGALGVPGTLISTTQYTRWRRRPNGFDVWHPSIFVEQAVDIEGSKALAERTALRLRNAAC